MKVHDKLIDESSLATSALFSLTPSEFLSFGKNYSDLGPRLHKIFFFRVYISMGSFDRVVQQLLFKEQYCYSAGNIRVNLVTKRGIGMSSYRIR